MPKISTEQRQARRDQILAAALKCFSRDGFHQTTMSDIVRESGLSQGTLYLYFKSKDDLIAAIADDRHRREAALNALAEGEQDPLQSILMLSRLYATRLLEHANADDLRVSLQGWAEALRNERVKAGVLDGLTLARDTLVRVIRRGQKRGTFNAKLDAAAAARLLIAIFQGFVLQAVWEPDQDLEACFRMIDELVPRLLR
ncbi:MAG: TetR/AcrR family transcriptional regulator [Steroidobacteraceae bacterium]|jgi:AcrR family transcriptional regulator